MASRLTSPDWGGKRTDTAVSFGGKESQNENSGSSRNPAEAIQNERYADFDSLDPVVRIHARRGGLYAGANT
jgi:hypothetical protein